MDHCIKYYLFKSSCLFGTLTKNSRHPSLKAQSIQELNQCDDDDDNWVVQFVKNINSVCQLHC